MADLKFIMHMGEDEDEDLGNDKYSRRPSLSDPARGPNPSSTAKISENNHPPSETDPGSSQPRRRGPLNRSSRPNTAASPTTVTASEDKASPPPRSLSEKKSIDHIEPMDTGHYGSYAHSPSSSNMPPSARSSASSRPPQGEGNIPVRLTPVTGRVSRAKKGVPVHICDICKPSKTFTRAEHLRRHQLSHKPAAFQCEYPGCGKAFHRQDLLTRHTQRHEQDDRSGSTSHQPSHTPVERPHAGYLQAPILPGNTMSIADEMTTNTSYPGGSVSPYSTSHRGSFSGQGAISPSAHSTRSHSAGPSHSHDEYILSSTSSTSYSMHPSSMDGSPFYSSYGLGLQPRKPPSYFMGMEALNVTIPDSNLPGHLSQDTNWPSSASDSPYSTPDMGIRGFESPNADVANEMFYVPHHYPSPQQPVYHPTSDYNTSYADDGLYEMSSQPFSSPLASQYQTHRPY
ncbi:putative C2H2 finger domain-containing protein [Rosellinia necatrix]|uniref:Putative C2H2 finger domain-containing protein n=1 Tax=Rosellinia necatrix TaxID=77044 RepID=A0A1S8A6F0_ROSNE|nr:putative C2H2 finger domain-containing protein [Rosellinia necatrix]